MNSTTRQVNGQPRPIDPDRPIEVAAVNADRSPVNTGQSAVNAGRGSVNKRPPVDDGGKKPSAAVRLVQLARERYTFVVSTDGRPYAVAVDGPNIALPLRGRSGVRQRLARLYAETFDGDV
ncbi:ATP-binding protein, partial [Streptomyces sp. NPDC020807]